MSEIELIRQIDALQKRVERFEAGEFATGEWVYLQAPLASTSWDGDSFSTTAKTLIDLSAVFTGVPAGIRAVYLRVSIRDSGSAGAAAYIILGPTNTAGAGLSFECGGVAANDYYVTQQFVVPCDANGDVYYQIVATGAATFDVIIQVWGYLL